MSTQSPTGNHLRGEKSPYLQQHADNPVDWYPWGEEAFRKASAEDKPVFLSIGYSTCHWCHVMERESFADGKVAELLNRYYVSIKVDREERPDIDTIYMRVCQMLTGRGGWPLTILMTPQKEPFFAGTYFPKLSRSGQPGLITILNQVRTLWTEEREALLASGRKIVEALKQNRDSETPEGQVTPHRLREVIDRAFGALESSFDERYGGFQVRPKFPTPSHLFFLGRYHASRGDDLALKMLEKTLEGMYRGGIYDHIGGGFCRYATDRQWLVPHFEKMLYDNALLTMVYLEAYQITGNQDYARIAEEIVTYLLSNMKHTEGGFYTAEDADSEGGEGTFYLWTPREVKKVLGKKEGERFCARYGIAPEGNFRGRSIPNLITCSLQKGVLDEAFSGARQKLLDVREKRDHPFRDDKILTGWNGLAIAALARAGRILGNPDYTTAASQTQAFIDAHLRRDDGRLLARYRQGEAAHLATADDYCYLIWGLLELYQATFASHHLAGALELNHQLTRLFWDAGTGGLYFYGSDAEELITRPKELYDGALPSGNSTAAMNYLHLARLTRDPELEERASDQITAFLSQAQTAPAAHTFFLGACLFAGASRREVIITGSRDDAGTRAMFQSVHRNFLPFTVTLYAGEADIYSILPHLADHKAGMDNTRAHICQDFTCLRPVETADQLDRVLSTPLQANDQQEEGTVE